MKFHPAVEVISRQANSWSDLALEGTTVSIWITDVVNIIFAIILVLINGFFVAAEFAMVKVRPSLLDEQVGKNSGFAATGRWLIQRMDASLSACQLGITMASLGLGWIGEPAIANLLRPLLQAAGVVSEIWIHGIAFAVAFTAITAAHLVFGEQAPKIFALRRPEKVLLWFALPKLEIGSSWRARLPKC